MLLRRVFAPGLLFAVGIFLASFVADRGWLVSRGEQLSAQSSEQNAEYFEEQAAVPKVSNQRPSKPETNASRLISVPRTTSQVVPSGGPTAYASSNISGKRETMNAESSATLRPEVLVAAIEDGNLESLKLFRPERLQKMYNYETKILPLVKKQALESLLERMSEQEIADWPRAAFELGGQRTSARRFVDDFHVVNPELGNYLETSALLFYGLYNATHDGRVYDVNENYEQIVGDAEELLAYRRRMAVPAKDILLKSVISDSVFLNVLEKKRGEYVAQFISEHQSRLNEHLQLLDSVEPRLSGSQVFRSVTFLLRRIALSGSTSLRDRIFQREYQTKSFQRFAELDAQSRQSLAELYAVGAVDALERQNPTEARQLLSSSRAVQSGLKSQDVVEQHIRLLEYKLAAQQEPAKPEHATALSAPQQSIASQEYIEEQSEEAAQQEEIQQEEPPHVKSERASELGESAPKKKGLGALSALTMKNRGKSIPKASFSWGTVFFTLILLGGAGYFGYIYFQGGVVWTQSKPASSSKSTLSPGLGEAAFSPQAKTATTSQASTPPLPSRSRRKEPELNLSTYESHAKKPEVANL